MKAYLAAQDAQGWLWWVGGELILYSHFSFFLADGKCGEAPAEALERFKIQ